MSGKSRWQLLNKLSSLVVAVTLNFTLVPIWGLYGAVTAWAAVMEFLGMLEVGHIKIDDILLLFIYLELLAMSGIYFRTNHMPLRFLLYIGVTALIRLLISDVSHHKSPDEGILYLTGGVVLLSVSILVVRYASARFPSVREKTD